MQWILIIAFGIVGVCSRFSIDSWMMALSFSLPIGTLVVNILGCFLAGFLFGIHTQPGSRAEQLRLGLIVGFCGGFTTFSGFGLHFVRLVGDHQFIEALIYSAAGTFICLLATAAGLFISRVII